MSDIRDENLDGVHLHCMCGCSDVHFYRWDEKYLGKDWTEHPPLYHFAFNPVWKSRNWTWWMRIKDAWRFFKGYHTEDMTFSHEQVVAFRDELSKLLTEPSGEKGGEG